jgi:hypothetical protein
MTIDINDPRGSVPMPPTAGIPARPPAVRSPLVVEPDSVKEARTAYQRILIRDEEIADKKRAAKDAATAARAADIVADADAIAAGEDPGPASKRQHAKAAAALEEIEREHLVNRTALLKTRATLRAAIVSVRDEWLSAVETEESEAAAEFAAAVEALDAPAKRLAAVRGAAQWLEEVSNVDVPTGVSTRQMLTRVAGSQHEVADLVAGLRGVTAPPKPTHRPASPAESVFVS